ncbi:hypothetical protein I4U23_028159 [Adineta vaga]|nr:hypothetical protein I4U23_028159 [Adineta vaga]
MGFIVIGMMHKNSCLAKIDLPLFLIGFGLLILVNLLICFLIGLIFLTFTRHTRLFSFERDNHFLIGTLIGLSFALCHPIVYWTGLIANIFGLIGFIIQICIAIDDRMTASKQSLKSRH